MTKWPQVKEIDKYINKISKVLSSDNWTIRSQKPGCYYFTEEFEKKWAEFCGKKYALLVSSGFSALEVSLRVLNIKENDEVIIPALGWYATAAAVTKVGATPIFCDVDPNTTCLDSKKVNSLITSKTKAIIAVHLHCSFAPLLDLRDLCAKYNIILLEDAAQAHGGMYLQQSPGHYSRAACYSFNQEKLIPSGEGGAIVTNDEDFHKKAYAIRTDGYNYYKDKGWIPSGTLGSNYAISEFQSAILLNSLEEFSYFNKIRLNSAQKIYNVLKPIKDVQLIYQAPETTNPFFYEIGIKFSDHILSRISLDRIIEIMNNKNAFQVGRTDIPIPENPLFSPYFKGKKPNMLIENAINVYNSLVVFHHKFLLMEKVEEMLLESINEILYWCESADLKGHSLSA